jgi:hypothetical protein
MPLNPPCFVSATFSGKFDVLTGSLAYLRLHGASAKEHPVFLELTRVKQYFEKIRALESHDTASRTSKLDKAAAGRFIKRALVMHENPPS